MNKFEVFQKISLKLILSEQELSYSNKVYIRKCKLVNIRLLFCRFNFNDMNLFHKIVYKNHSNQILGHLSDTDICPTTEISFSDKRPCRTRIRKRTLVVYI